jgi:hypothetical protein
LALIKLSLHYYRQKSFCIKKQQNNLAVTD